MVPGLFPFLSLGSHHGNLCRSLVFLRTLFVVLRGLLRRIQATWIPPIHCKFFLLRVL